MKDLWSTTELNKEISNLKDIIAKDEERLKELQSITPYPDDLVARIKNAEPRKEYYGYYIQYGKQRTKLDKGAYYSIDWLFPEKEKIALADGEDFMVEIEKPFEPSTYKKLSIREVFDIWE